MGKGASGKVVLVIALMISPAAFGETTAASNTHDQLRDAWKTMRVADVDSEEFTEAGIRLLRIVEKLTPSERSAAATTLMDRYAPDNVNAAAIELFGTDPFEQAEIRDILSNSKRTFAQRVLIRTYYTFVRNEYETSPLTEGGRMGLLHLLTDRIKSLNGKPVGYGEQRLLVHLSQSVLSRYANKTDEVPQARWLIEAMGVYARSAAPKDTFAASIQGWLDLLNAGASEISTLDKAIAAMGHWDSLVRWKASGFVARAASEQPQAVMLALQALTDSRDEVRAAAVGVFTVGSEINPQQTIQRLVTILTRDPGVIVQAAASDTLAARADQDGATEAISPLLEAFDPAKNRIVLRRKRTNSILAALGALAGRADAMQREQMLKIAVKNLSKAPQGSLELLRALGPDAQSALPAVRDYRRTADRFDCQYIDRHVLPAIDPNSPPPRRP